MKSCEGSGYLTTIEGSGSFRTWSSTDSLHICMQWASTVLILQVCIDSQYIHTCYNNIETVLIDTHHTRYIWSEVQLFDPSTFFTRLHLTTPRMHVSTHPPLCSPLQYLCTIYWLDPTTSSVLFSHTSMTTFPSHPTMCDSWHLQVVNANDRKACHANLIQLRESTEEEDKGHYEITYYSHNWFPKYTCNHQHWRNSYMLHYTCSALSQQWGGSTGYLHHTSLLLYFRNLNNHTAAFMWHKWHIILAKTYSTHTHCVQNGCLDPVQYTAGHSLTLPISSLQQLMGESTSMASPHLHVNVHAYTYRESIHQATSMPAEQEIL